MGKININYTNGAIGGVLPSDDYISSFIFDSSVLPSGFSATDRIKIGYSVQDFVNLGITNTSIDETKATTGGTIAITAVGAVGDYINVYIQPKNHAKVLLGSYTVKSGDTTVIVANGLISNINLNTSSTKWTSVLVTGSTLSLVAPVGLGEALNGSNIITTTSKASTTFNKTIVDFSGGVGSKIDIMYHILDSYFKANSNSKVYVGIYDFTSAYDSTKIATVQTFAKGSIRQMGMWLKKGLETIVSTVNNTQATVLDQTTKHKPLNVVLSFQSGTTTSCDDLIDTRSLSARQVSTTISNGYGVTNRAYNLKGITGYYPTDIGSVLGHISRSKVSNSIAWVGENNVIENEDIMIVTGEKWLDLEDTVKPDQIFNKGYIFEKQYFGLSGVYFDNDSVHDSFTSDYDSIKRSRTIDKAARLSYLVLLPYLSSPVLLNPADGTLTISSIITFISAINSELDSMKNSKEISGYNVLIDPKQNLLVTKNLQVTVQIVPVASADVITVNLGYAVSLQ